MESATKTSNLSAIQALSQFVPNSGKYIVYTGQEKGDATFKIVGLKGLIISAILSIICSTAIKDKTVGTHLYTALTTEYTTSSADRKTSPLIDAARNDNLTTTSIQILASSYFTETQKKKMNTIIEDYTRTEVTETSDSDVSDPESPSLPTQAVLEELIPTLPFTNSTAPTNRQINLNFKDTQLHQKLIRKADSHLDSKTSPLSENAELQLILKDMLQMIPKTN